MDSSYYPPHRKAPVVSESDAIEDCCETYEKMVRDVEKAGRELPIVDVPASLGDSARISVETGEKLIRRAHRRTFFINLPWK